MKPTVEQFLDRLPNFQMVEMSTIQVWIDEAWGLVGPGGFDDDETSATIYYSAHLMSMVGLGPEAGANALAPVKSLSTGSLGFTKEDKYGDFSLTSYGRLFYPMLRAHRGGMRVTGTGTVEADADSPYAWHGRVVPSA